MNNNSTDALRAVWVTRSFLDYRVPVYAELDKLCGNQLHLIYSSEYVPERVQNKIKAVLGDRAIALGGEWSLGDESMSRMSNRVLSIRLHPHLPKLINSLRPQVLIGDGFFKWTAGAIARRMSHGTPLVVCYERTQHTERNAQWYRIAYRRIVMRFVDAMCCNGVLCSDYAKTLGMPDVRMNTGHMAADTSGIASFVDKISPQKKAAIKRRLGCRGKVLLYVGRMISFKGVDHLLNGWAAAMTADEVEKATLICVGGGEQLEQLRGIAKARGLDNVIFTGAIDYDSMGEYYGIADCFVIATLEDNWSLVVPEAMAAGLPILCSKYNGCWPELVKEGVNGWVFDPLDKDNTVAALQKFMAAGSKLAEMGQQSKKLVADYTPQKAAGAIFDACQTAVTHARLSRPGFSDLDGALICK